MRITQVIPALSLLALAGCSKADAAPVDPNDDFDARSRPSSSTKRQSFRGPRIISGTLYWS